MNETGFKIFVSLLLFSAFVLLLKKCDSYHLEVDDPQNIVKRDRVKDLGDSEVWKVCTYTLCDTKYDTVPEKERKYYLP